MNKQKKALTVRKGHDSTGKLSKTKYNLAWRILKPVSLVALTLIYPFLPIATYAALFFIGGDDDE